jgi:hypothetical protein
MTDYVKSTNFAAKDALASGNAGKIVKGTEIDTEFNNIATAVATKANSTSPTFTGTVVIPTATITTATITTANISGGTITGITDLAVVDGGTGASTAADARTNLGLVIGTNVQAWDTDLDTWATKTAPSGTVIGTTDTQTLTNKTLSTGTVVDTSLIVSRTAQASTSGTSIDFPNIPNWVKRITVSFNAVVTSGSSPIIIKLGDAGGFEDNSYTGAGCNTSSGPAFGGTANTVGFNLMSAAASGGYDGAAVLTLQDTLTWVLASTLVRDQSSFSVGGGNKATSATLTQIRITTVNGTDTFSSGSINIMYE